VLGDGSLKMAFQHMEKRPHSGTHPAVMLLWTDSAAEVPALKQLQVSMA